MTWMHTETFIREAPTSQQAYEDLKKQLGELGWNITHFHSCKEVAQLSHTHLWELTVEVTRQK